MLQFTVKAPYCTVYLSSMQCQVVLLRRDGVRLKRAEWGEALHGHLEVRDWPSGSSFKRPVRIAELWSGPVDYPRTHLTVPIFDPVLLRLRNDSFILSGTELQTHEGRTAEHVQMWLCLLGKAK